MNNEALYYLLQSGWSIRTSMRALTHDNYQVALDPPMDEGLEPIVFPIDDLADASDLKVLNNLAKRAWDQIRLRAFASRREANNSIRQADHFLRKIA